MLIVNVALITTRLCSPDARGIVFYLVGACQHAPRSSCSLNFPTHKQAGTWTEGNTIFELRADGEAVQAFIVVAYAFHGSAVCLSVACLRAGKRPAARAGKQAAQEQAEAHKADGNAAFQAGAYEEAVRAYTQAAEADPGCAVYWSNRAQAYLKVCPGLLQLPCWPIRGLPKHRLAQQSRSHAISMCAAALMSLKACVHALDEAQTRVTAGADLALEGAEQLSCTAGRASKGFTYSRSLAFCSHHTELTCVRGCAQLMQFEAAEADCDKALKLELSVKTLLRRGTARRGKQDIEGARRDFKHALGLEPNNRWE